MGTPGPATTDINVAILTAVFQIRGKLPVLGNLQTFINDEQRPTFAVRTAQILGLSLANPAAQMAQAEIIVNKRDAQVIIIEGLPPQGGITLLPKIENLVVYTSQFAVMGKWHMGADSRLNDFAEASLAPFLAVSEARIFPLFQARPGMVGAATIAMVHKTAFVTYHRTS